MIDCKMTVNVSSKLIDLLAQGATIQELAIVNCNLTEKSIDTITKYAV